jgi:copper homeostasis protein (lipoprotein)
MRQLATRLAAFFLTVTIVTVLQLRGNADQPPTPAPSQPTGQSETLDLDVPFPLPATFQGTTACADCPGIRTTITLNADGTYLLEREYLERPATSHENGHWGYDKSRSLLTLYPPGNSTPQFFAINVNPSLQAADAQGKAIASSANFAYAPWLTFADAPLPLESTSWRLSSLAGQPLSSADATHAPTLMFDAAEKRVSGSGGCNRITGSYNVNGDKLDFGPIASTKMACPQPIMDTESAFLRQLSAVNSYKIDGGSLTLYSADGTPLVTFVPNS